MEVNPSFPARTAPEFIAYGKANPGKISFASSGIGTGSHLAGERFKIMAGVNMVHVPYRGTGPALTDLMSGQVQVVFFGAVESVPFIAAPATQRPSALLSIGIKGREPLSGQG